MNKIAERTGSILTACRAHFISSLHNSELIGIVWSTSVLLIVANDAHAENAEIDIACVSVYERVEKIYIAMD